MKKANHLPGMLFTGAPCTGHSRAIDQGSTLDATPEESGNAIQQATHCVTTALLCIEPRIDAQRTKSFCCAAAGITTSCSSTQGALIPHKRLRWAAPAETTLIASDRPHAQLAKGYKHICSKPIWVRPGAAGVGTSQQVCQ